MKIISIIIPSYNSEKSIINVIKEVKKIKIPRYKIEIIVVNDCSKDNTHNILKNVKGIIYIQHHINTGKGGAVKTGCEKAKGNILYIQDDDMEYHPKDIKKVLTPILRNKNSIVFGSRHLQKNNPHSSFTYYLGGWIIDKIISLVLGVRMSDAITGSKGFTREVYNKIKPIESKGFEIEVEIATKAVKNNFIPKEVPIKYNPRTHKQGKNIRWHHAFPILKSLFKNYLA